MRIQTQSKHARSVGSVCGCVIFSLLEGDTILPNAEQYLKVVYICVFLILARLVASLQILAMAWLCLLHGLTKQIEVHRGEFVEASHTIMMNVFLFPHMDIHNDAF